MITKKEAFENLMSRHSADLPANLDKMLAKLDENSDENIVDAYADVQIMLAQISKAENQNQSKLDEMQAKFYHIAGKHLNPAALNALAEATSSARFDLRNAPESTQARKHWLASWLRHLRTHLEDIGYGVI